ncbi:MAG: hypothetical protein HHAS10_06380 [Candidatus Altimarinota bacterium]
MRKIKDTTYDIFVKKIEQNMGKTYLRSDLFRMWQNAGGSKNRFAYGLGKAKNQKKILLLGGGIFQGISQNEKIQHIDDAYWEILSLVIREHSPSGAIIAHEKSMELHLKNYEIPETLVLYTRDSTKRVRVGPYTFHFRSLKSGLKSNAKNMFRIFEKYSNEIKIENHTFHTLGIELSLLDVTSLKLQKKGIAEDLILRFIKKYENSYNRDIFGEIIAHRYIRAMNRVRSIAKYHGFEKLYNISLDVIKIEGGGCFLNL